MRLKYPTPSILDDLPPLVAAASSSSCPDLLRVFNYIVKVSKIAAYLLRGEMFVDFSGSNVDDCLNGAEERSPKDDGGSYLSSPMSITFQNV